MPDTKLSAHFSLAELTRSAKATELKIDNTPNAAQIANLRRLALTALEPMRALLRAKVPGVVIRITSGYRGAAINKAVGSTAKKSAHLDGRAADTVPDGIDLDVAFAMIRKSDIPFTQVIREPTWIHIAVAEEGVKPRRQALLAKGKPGAWKYVTAPPLV